MSRRRQGDVSSRGSRLQHVGRSALPETALFQWERSQGRVELQQYTYDRDGRLLERRPDTVGQARWDRFTILIVISFRVTELKDAPDVPRPSEKE